MFVPCFDWNYLKLRSRLYIETSIVCFVLPLIGDGGRDSFFVFFQLVQPGSIRGGVRSIADLGMEVHPPLASATLSIDDKVSSAISKFGESNRSILIE